jgi:hypothetical protein
MSGATRIGLIALLMIGLAPGGALASVGEEQGWSVGSAWRRTPFVIGAPGRLDADGDRRHPRLYRRVESPTAAYADVEEVEDARWLSQEVEGYARRALDCAGLEPPWCQREVERRGTGMVIHLAAGAHAELVWLSGGTRAVRLGWRRIVDTGNGTMAIEAPPTDFAVDLLAAYPSQLAPLGFDAAHERIWTEIEVERLLYYLEQVVAGLPAVTAESARRHARRFVEQGLERIVRLRGLRSTLPPLLADGSLAAVTAPDLTPPRLADQLEALRAWPVDRTEPLCPASLLASPGEPPPRYSRVTSSPDAPPRGEVRQPLLPSAPVP